MEKVQQTELGNDVITRRSRNGVDIVEREMHQVIKLVDSRYIRSGPARESKLVVVEDVLDDRTNLITRDRRQIPGLDAFIRSVTRQRA